MDPDQAQGTVSRYRLHPQALQCVGLGSVPTLFGVVEQGIRRFIEFLTNNIRNKTTRSAYAQAVQRFAGWCEDKGFRMEELGAAKCKTASGSPPGAT